EEWAVGGLLGAGVGLAIASPLVLLAGPLPGFLPSSMAGESLWAYALHALTLSVALACAVCGAWFAGQQDDEEHVRGTRFYKNPQQAVAALQSLETPRMSDAQAAGAKPGIRIGGLEWSRSRETAHALVLGMPDAGKTAGALRPMVDQALARRDRVILHDPKSDFVSTHFDPVTTVLLGPWDARSVIWDAGRDFDDDALIDEFAAATCGSADAGQNAYFHNGAAAILAGLIKTFAAGGGWTWEQLAEALRVEPLARIRLAATGDERVQDVMPSVFCAPPGKPPQLGTGERGIVSTLGTAIRELKKMAAVAAARPDAQRFGLRAWLKGEAHQEIRLVILNNNALYKSSARALFGGMLAVLASSINADRDEQSADDEGVWVIVDEGKQLGPGGLEQVQEIAEMGRSKGVRVVLALQDASQLEAAVGRDKASPFTSMQSTRIYLRASPESADRIAQTIGAREVRRTQNTASGGALQGKTQNLPEPVPVLMSSDLTGLKTSKGRLGVDIQMLVAIEDVIGLLVQNSGPRPLRTHEPFERCPVWRGVAKAAAPEPQLAAAIPEPGDRAPQPDPDIDSPFIDEPASTPAPDESPFGEQDHEPDPAEDFDWTKE
ncbi:conjugal transfer protein (TraD), partial [mine drainage metagenome]